MMYRVSNGRVHQIEPIYKWIGKTDAQDGKYEQCPELIVPVYTPSLDRAIEEKCEWLRQKCEETIIGGFKSSAFGPEKTFDSTRDDQDNIRDLANICSMVIGGAPLEEGEKIKYKASGELECYAIEPIMGVNLYKDMVKFKQAVIDKKNSLRVRAKGCKSIEALDQITW